MNAIPPSRSSARPRFCGFSLPEVTLAVGVASVALMSVMGLLPILLSSDVENGANTTLTTLASQALGQISSERAKLGAGNAKPTKYDFYYTQDGELASSENDPKALYFCTVEVRPVANVVPDPGSYCSIVKLTFTTLGKARTTKIIHASLTDDV